MVKKKEKRGAILYVHIRPSIKKWLRGRYKRYGYSTLSEFVDTLLSDFIDREKNNNG